MFRMRMSSNSTKRTSFRLLQETLPQRTNSTETTLQCRLKEHRMPSRSPGRICKGSWKHRGSSDCKRQSEICFQTQCKRCTTEILSLRRTSNKILLSQLPDRWSERQLLRLAGSSIDSNWLLFCKSKLNIYLTDSEFELIHYLFTN